VYNGNNQKSLVNNETIIDKNDIKDKTFNNPPSKYDELLFPAISLINNLHGYINIKREFVIEPKYELCYSFNGDFAVVSKSGKYGIINKKGVEITPIIYSGLNDFSEGLALARKEKHKYGFIDTTGREAIPFIFYNAWAFSNGLAQVNITGKEIGYSYIDKFGNIIQCRLVNVLS
jgi:hypothetical protein